MKWPEKLATSLSSTSFRPSGIAAPHAMVSGRSSGQAGSVDQCGWLVTRTYSCKEALRARTASSQANLDRLKRAHSAPTEIALRRTECERKPPFRGEREIALAAQSGSSSRVFQRTESRRRCRAAAAPLPNDAHIIVDAAPALLSRPVRREAFSPLSGRACRSAR
jgi:hypothetical protein